jgi:two-component system chemotaxis response regulator CheY
MASFYLVDDSLFVLTQLKQILQKAGHTVAGTAQNGEAALAYLEGCSTLPDVITLDITMPGMDGIDVLRRIRKSWPEILCIVVTGLGKKDFVLEARGLGAAGYIIKPLNRDRVLEKLAEALSCF